MTTPLRLLILEDNPNDAKLMLHELRRAGYDPVADRVETEQDYRDRLQSTPEVILADFSMPEFNALLALEVLNESQLDIPVIIVSGSVGEERAVQVMQRGAADYVVKDRMGRLGQAVTQALEQKALREANRRAGQALRECEVRYKQLVESSQDAIISKTMDGIVLTWNQAAETIFGYGEEEMVGKSISKLFPAGRVNELPRILTMLKAGESIQDLITVKEKKDGTPVTVSLSISPIKNSAGRITCISVIVRDISEHKRLEDQLRQSQKMDAIGRLAGAVAHDFNNLLTVILGRAELTEQRPDLDENVRKNLNLIHSTASRAALLTRQLLQFSRQQILQPQVLDLNTVLPDMQEMLRRLISEDIDLIIKLSSKAGRIKADLGQIQQVVLNLVVNARDAMPNGGKLTIETANVDLDEAYCKKHVDAIPGPHVMLAVGDTGCGMDEKVRAQIFEPFFTTKELGKGSGLGLSTVFGIVKQAGGNIYVYSEVNHGTIFKVYIPEVKEKARAAKSSSSLLPVTGGAETILLVEDEEGIRDLLNEILMEKGYTVLLAEDGKDAIQRGESHKGTIHLLLTDVVMPKMNGKEVANELLLSRADMRVLFMSGYTSDAIVSRGVLDEGIEFLEKPFTPQSVARRVREVLDRSKPARNAVPNNGDPQGVRETPEAILKEVRLPAVG